MNKRNLGIVLVVIVALAIGGYFFLPFSAKAPTAGMESNAAQKADLIVAYNPQPGSSIPSPLTVSGKARGYWYFEASFPYELRGADGKTIAEGPVQATGDWMTEDFVPFSIAITFPKQPTGSKGVLILKKDNPSGLPENEDSLIIPILFQ